MTDECPHCHTRVILGTDGICPRCAQANKVVQPQHVDLENYEMTFLVHKGFKKALDETTR